MAPGMVWAQPRHRCVPPEEESAALSQDAHKVQEVLVTQETQAASFSKHRRLKPKSSVLVHWSKSPLSIYSGTGAGARCLLSIQGMLESLLLVSQDFVLMSASCQAPEVFLLVLQLCCLPRCPGTHSWSHTLPPGEGGLSYTFPTDLSFTAGLFPLALSWATYWGTFLWSRTPAFQASPLQLLSLDQTFCKQAWTCPYAARPLPV